MWSKKFSAWSVELCKYAMAVMRCMAVKGKVFELDCPYGHLCNKDGLTMLMMFAEF